MLDHLTPGTGPHTAARQLLLILAIMPRTRSGIPARLHKHIPQCKRRGLIVESRDGTFSLGPVTLDKAEK